MESLRKVAISAGVVSMPMFAYAQGGSLITDIIFKVVSIFNWLIVLIMVLGTVVFLWGIISYIAAAGDEQKITQAKHYMLYGIITLFVMASVWGLVYVLVNTFGIGTSGTPIAPGYF